MSRRRFLVAWDIAHPRRLKRIHRIARDYGNPLQKSVFLCELGKAEMERLKERMGKVAHRKEDQVLFLDLGPEGRDPTDWLEVIGMPPAIHDRTIVV